MKYPEWVTDSTEREQYLLAELEDARLVAQLLTSKTLALEKALEYWRTQAASVQGLEECRVQLPLEGGPRAGQTCLCDYKPAMLGKYLEGKQAWLCNQCNGYIYRERVAGCTPSD